MVGEYITDLDLSRYLNYVISRSTTCSKNCMMKMIRDRKTT